MKDEAGDFRILDPTWIPLSREMWSSREALQGLVYGTPEGETLTLSPYYAPDYNQWVCRGKTRIDESGALETRISMNVKGYPDTYLRRNVFRYSKPEVRAGFEKALNIAPNARLEDFRYTDPYDYSHDGQVRMRVSAERYAAGGGSRRMMHLPLMSHPLADWFIPDFFYPLDKDERTYGMRLRATRHIRYEETVELPDGWNVERLPEARDMLGEMGHIIVALAERLKRRESPYAAVLAALSELAGVEATSEAVQELLAVRDDDAALDTLYGEGNHLA